MDNLIMISGMLNTVWWIDLLIVLITTHITILSVTIYLHRNQAHSALQLHPSIAHFFRFWLWLTTGTDTKTWVSIHRKHHAHCETQEDPHSPLQHGIKKVLTEGYELYVEAESDATKERYGQRTPEDWIERNLYRKYKNLGIITLLGIFIVLFGLSGIWMWGIQMLWIPFFAAGVVNGLGHWWGYRNYECDDNAHNIFPLGILIGGEELHNNHHSFPNSPKLSRKPWEFDAGWAWIKVLSWLRLAKPRSVEPIFEKVNTPQEIDKNCFMALKNRRLHILRSYDFLVLKKMYPNLPRSQRKLILSINKWKSERDKKIRQEILSSDNEIVRLYNYYHDLLSIWKKEKGETINDQVEKLKIWCEKAESSGIDFLKQYSLEIRRYTLPS